MEVIDHCGYVMSRISPSIREEGLLALGDFVVMCDITGLSAFPFG